MDDLYVEDKELLDLDFDLDEIAEAIIDCDIFGEPTVFEEEEEDLFENLDLSESDKFVSDFDDIEGLEEAMSEIETE